MFKVLIVEDDEFVSMGLRNMVRWTDMGMEVVGEARDGREGLAMYQREKPDIILADVRMPVMSGIDMIAKIRKQDTRTRIVVFSCHEDYEYVRQAFKLGISDYILKVRMMPEDIETIMKRVQQELLHLRIQEQEREEKREENILDKCRAYILDAAISNEAFRTCARELGLKEERFVVCIMEVALLRHKQGEDAERKRQIIPELVQKKLNQKNSGFVLWDEGNRYLLILYLPGEGNYWEKGACLDVLLGELSSLLQTYINGAAAFGLSGCGASYEELHGLYREALEAQQKAAFLGETVWAHGRAAKSGKYAEALEACEGKIAAAKWLSDGCRQKIGKEIAFHKSLDDADVDTIKEVFNRWSHRVSFDSMVQRKETLSIVLETAKQTRSAASLRELVDIFDRYLDTMSRVKDSKLVSPEVAAAIVYIRDHFWNEGICLAEVAGHVGMSKDYLSTVFKRDTGQGFSDYLNSVRIGKACELLENTVMKAYEISQAVGFQDESYFSRIFKKMTGMRPNEYRRRQFAPDAAEWKEGI